MPVTKHGSWSRSTTYIAQSDKLGRETTGIGKDHMLGGLTRKIHDIIYPFSKSVKMPFTSHQKQYTIWRPIEGMPRHPHEFSRDFPQGNGPLKEIMMRWRQGYSKGKTTVKRNKR